METLAIVYGAEKFHQFIYGRPTVVESDHKPLQYILKRPLHRAPLRLQKMTLTLQRYVLNVKYRPGVELSVADALSRSYLPETTETLIPDLEVNEVHLTTRRGLSRSWVRFPPRSKHFFFTSCGSLIPFTRANAQWVIHGFN